MPQAPENTIPQPPEPSIQQSAERLYPRGILDLNEQFRIPSYQRGYRWGKRQVVQLLDDIDSFFRINCQAAVKPYYLQPIVVAPVADRPEGGAEVTASAAAPAGEAAGPKKIYDLIDGQQRLTTIYLILSFLQSCRHPEIPENLTPEVLQEALKGLTKLTSLAGKADAAGIPEKPNYSIEYETRASSRLFIEQIAQKKAGDGSISDSPDHLYMWHAYQFISEWFLSHDENFISKALAESVKIIWYELPVAVENWQKFTDLNVGKIPLTNSELVKALFLRSDSGSLQMPEYEKETLIAQWDEMERELHDLDFWYFLTTDAPELYPTRIDFIFNLIAGKKRDNKDDFFTFDYFVEKFQKEADRSGKQQWDDIYLKYQRIRDWYRDRELYHQIGYLVSTGYKALGEIFKVAYPDDEKLLKTRSEFRIYLEDSISDSIKMPEKDGKTLADLSYGTDDTLITRILTLYNIMVCEAVAGHVRYPFARHNAVSGGWSLEHIHAQNSEDLKKAEHWKEWIAAHKATLQAVVEAGILDEESTLRAEGLIGGFENFDRDPTRVLFAKLAGEFEAVMNSLPGASGLRKNEIRNLALLGRDMNAVLNNSTFDVKRRKIISMVGTDYVPIATERAFLKAIAGHRTDSEGNYIPGGEYECNASQIFFWGEQDRQAYLADIEEKLKKYRRQ